MDFVEKQDGGLLPFAKSLPSLGYLLANILDGGRDCAELHE